MKQVFYLSIISILAFFSACSSGDDLVGNWSYKGSYAGAPRSNAVSFVIGNYAYVGTGYDGEDRLRSFKKFNIETESWEDVNAPGDAFNVRQQAVAFAVNGKGYVGTGFDGDYTRYNDFWEFDPVSETWAEVAEFPGGARQNAVAFTIGSYGYVGTGYGYLDGDDKKHLNDYYRFDPTQTGEDQWTSIGTHGDKIEGASAFVIGESAYILLGKRSGGTLSNRISKFDGNTQTWDEDRKKLDDDNDSQDVLRTDAVTFVIDGKGYVATGYSSGLNRDVWEYDPVKDSWKEKTELETEVSARQNAVGFSINNRGFITTGSSGTSYLDDMWEFQPNIDEDEDDN